MATLWIESSRLELDFFENPYKASVKNTHSDLKQNIILST